MDGACCRIIGLENCLPVGQVGAVKSGAVNGGDGLFANFEAVTKIDNSIIFFLAILVGKNRNIKQAALLRCANSLVNSQCCFLCR